MCPCQRPPERMNIRDIRSPAMDMRHCPGSSADCLWRSASPGGGRAGRRGSILSSSRRTRRIPIKINDGLRAIIVAVVGLAASAAAAEPLKIDFSNETVGAEPKSLVSVVGIWRSESGGADKARAVYGDLYAEFLDRVQAYAYFPYTVAKDVQDFKNGEITVRFEGISGRIDQGAGILFNLKPNGDYLTVRANSLENNLVLWKFEKGKRSSVKSLRHPPTPSRRCRQLKVGIAGPKVEASLDGKPYLEHTLPEPVSGRIGLWSKAGSHASFDGFPGNPANSRPPPSPLC